MASVINYGPTPQPCICSYCHANIKTDIVCETSTRTHLTALLLCAVGCFCFMCIPYCTDSCMNRNHYCPSCHAYLGTYAS